MKLRSLGLSLALALGLSALSAPALANGRFPAAGQIAVDPSDPTHIVVRATYGLVTTHDTGKHWSWICESSVGYGGFEDPMVSLTADGSVMAGIFEGLSVTHDSGCQWDFAQGGLANKYVIDLATDKNDPKSAVLLLSNSVGGSMFLTQMWESKDNAGTWAQTGVNLPADFLGLTLDAAPSDPERVYVSGRFGGPDFQGTLERTKDRGKTWEKLPIPQSNDTNLPYIGGVDPQNPDVVYVRLDGAKTDHLVASKDGGATWTEAFTSSGNLFGFAVSPDGSTVALGGDTDGIWTAPAGTLAFQKMSNVGARCLTWTSEGLYACGDEFVDGFTVGVSKDMGRTFQPLMHLQVLCGPLACGANTSTGKQCPDLWASTQLALGGASCDGGGAGTNTGASTGAGSASNGGSGGGSSGGNSGGSAFGCTCSFSSATAAGAFFPALALAGAALARRRRRRR
jgi:MYXO-CTERM domain-containing protein